MSKDIFVVVEQRNGVIQKVGIELLGEAQKLAKDLGEDVVAVLMGSKIKDQAQSLIDYGASRVLVVDDPVLEYYTTEPYAKALTHIIKTYEPNIVLYGASSIGRDLAPRVAGRVHTGLTADCTKLSIDPETKLLQMTRPAFGGNIMATIMTPNHRPQMATVRPKVFKKAPPDPKRKGQVLLEALKLIAPQTKLVKTIKDAESVDIAAHDILIAGGRGLKKEENFKQLFRLAELLGGEVACSRAVVDAGWAPVARQVGQTGKTVAPKLYLCFGISGAIQHLEGIRGADTIIAVNSDPNAPIFGVADLGIVGDLFEIVPALIKELEK